MTRNLLNIRSTTRDCRQRTFLSVTLYLSARSRFQHPARYSNAVPFAGNDAMTVASSGSSVMLEGERDKRASKSRSVHSLLSLRGVGRSERMWGPSAAKRRKPAEEGANSSRVTHWVLQRQSLRRLL